MKKSGFDRVVNRKPYTSDSFKNEVRRYGRS